MIFFAEYRKVNYMLTRIWHVPAKHANPMDARAHTSTLAECAPRFMTPRSQGFVGQSSPNLAHFWHIKRLELPSTSILH